MGMDELSHHPSLHALEPAAQSRIIERAQIIHDWLAHGGTAPSGWRDDMVPAPEHIQVILANVDNDPHGQQHLYTLADTLGLSSLAEQITLRQCHQHGCFDRKKPYARCADQCQPHEIQPVQPDARSLKSRICELLRRIPDRQERIDAFVREGFCRNYGNAQAVAALVEQSERYSDDKQVQAAHSEGHIAPEMDTAAAAQAIRAVFHRVSETDQRAQELVRVGVCPNHEHAQALVRRFERRDAGSSRYNHVLDKCFRRGLFKHLPTRPEMDTVFQRVAAIFAAVTDQDDRVQMLRWAGICSDEQRARHVVTAHTECRTPSERAVIAQCWNAGYFDCVPPPDRMRQPEHAQPYALRLPFDELETNIAVILRSGTTLETQREALVALGCCRDAAAAHQVVDAFNRQSPASAVNRCAALLARQILTSYEQYHLVGLLKLSDYAPAQVLFFVQRAVSYINETSENPATTLAVLQRDLVAVYRAFHSVDHTLWRRDLFNAPPVSQNRQYCHQQISPEQRTTIIATLQSQDAYSEDEATTIYDLLVERGGYGVIDWRCGITFEDAGHAWERQRLRGILDYHLGALPSQALQRIATDVQHLKAAMQESGVTISLTQLLNSQPSSAFRRRLNRRLPVSYGQVQFFRRIENQQQRRQHAYRTRARNQRQTPQHDPLTAASALVAQVAARTGLTEREAAGRLYQVRTYGGIGFLPKEQWLALIDARLLALLKFYKFVRIEERLNVPQAVQQVNRYAHQLGLTPLSAQLAKALNGAIAKPRRWNGGESDRTATVRKNANVVLPGTPWLHRVWRLFHMPLNLPIAASSFSESSVLSHMLLVVDLGSQLPTGLWISAHPPGSAEMGLALFQAIWHPGAVDWPLRGAPELLQVPSSMLTDGDDLLERAAEWLQMRVQVVPDAGQTTTLRKLPILQALLDNLILVGLSDIQRRHARQPRTVKDVQDAILGWIRTSEAGFAHHTPGRDDPVSVMYGVTTPGFNTPVAGLLLPVSGRATTVRDGVIVHERRYTHPYFRSEPGHMVAYRAFPYLYDGLTPDEGMQEALYVEDHDGLVQYVTRQV